jgi:peptide/nickel transport system ATP-binding protein
MYAGHAAEIANIRDIFEKPLHPYTQLLISSLPTLREKGVFRGIPGITPSLLNAPENECLFRARCPKAMDICAQKAPVQQEMGPGRWVACHLYREVKR